MQFFLSAAVRACQKGVVRAHLIGRKGDGAILQELFTRDGIGTMISVDSLDNLRPATIEGCGRAAVDHRAAGASGAFWWPAAGTDRAGRSASEHDGRVIGCAALYPFPANKAELACLAVNPDYRREGYGERLMKAVERAAKEHGINTLFVLTTRTAAWFTERGSAGDDHRFAGKKQALYNFERASQVYVKQI